MPESGQSTRHRLREQMPVTESWAYFDHAAVCPIPLVASAAISDWQQAASHEGGAAWLTWDRATSRLRTGLAQLINAHEEEICLIPSTTAGINLVAEGFPFHSGDNVVTLADEFPSNIYPWMNLKDRGVETRLVPTDRGQVDMQEFADAIDQKTRIVSISWVAYANGFRRDIRSFAEIVHRKGALLFVDAIQGLGVFPLDVEEAGVDFLAADGHKWMLGPEGAGVAYIRREHLSRLRPLGVGWNSVRQSHDFSEIKLDLKPTAARYEGGTRNHAGFLALGASLELLLSLGIPEIAQSILEFTDELCQELANVGAEIVSRREGDCRSGIVAFRLTDKDHQQIRKECFRQQILISERNGCLRVSPHAYNNRDDLERLIKVVAR